MTVQVSLITKIVPSPDWFIGLDSLDLCREGEFIDQISLEVSVFFLFFISIWVFKMYAASTIVGEQFDVKFLTQIYLKDNQSLYKYSLDWIFFYVRYSTLLHLPPLRILCVGACWERTQDCCDFGLTDRRSNHSARSHPLAVPVQRENCLIFSSQEKGFIHKRSWLNCFSRPPSWLW